MSNKPLSSVGLPAHVLATLARAGVETVGDVEEQGHELLNINGIGEKLYARIIDACASKPALGGGDLNVRYYRRADLERSRRDGEPVFGIAEPKGAQFVRTHPDLGGFMSYTLSHRSEHWTSRGWTIKVVDEHDNVLDIRKPA